MTDWCFQPTKARHYTKIGGIGRLKWFDISVPVIEGIFISSDTKNPSDKDMIPVSEIRWMMEEGRMLMIHQTRLGSIFGYFSILQTPHDFETAKRITGFKPYDVS